MLQNLPEELIGLLISFLPCADRCNLATALPSIYLHVKHLAFYNKFRPLLGKRTADGQRRANEAYFIYLHLLLNRIRQGSCTSIYLAPSHGLQDDSHLGLLCGALDMSPELKSFSTNRTLPHLDRILPRMKKLESLTYSPGEELDCRVWPSLKSLTLFLHRSQEKPPLQFSDTMEELSINSNTHDFTMDLNTMSNLRKLQLSASGPFQSTARFAITGTTKKLEHLILTGESTLTMADVYERPSTHSSHLVALSVCELRLPGNWHQTLLVNGLFDNLRSLEWYSMPVEHLVKCSFPRLQKLAVHTSSPMTANETDELATCVGADLEMLAISCVKSEEWAEYGERFVLMLFRSLKLKYFSSVGPLYFTRKDWETLCSRSFGHLKVLHVEQSRAKHLDNLDDDLGDRMYQNLEGTISPDGLADVQKGRVFVQAENADRWKTDKLLSVADIRRKIFWLADPQSHLALSREEVITGWSTGHRTDQVFAVHPHYEARLRWSVK